MGRFEKLNNLQSTSKFWQCLCLHIRGILMPSWQITCNIRSHYPCATLQMFSDLTATGADLHDKTSDYKRFSSAIFWPYMRLWEDHWQMATLTEKQARCVDKWPPLTFLIGWKMSPTSQSPPQPPPLRAFYGINQLPLRAGCLLPPSSSYKTCSHLFVLQTQLKFLTNKNFLDVIASPSLRFGDSYRISELCELVFQ